MDGDSRAEADLPPLLLPRLFIAVRAGDLATVETIIQEHPTAVHARDAVLNYRRTALHHACERGQVDVATFLINQGSEVQVLDAYGRTPLGVAASWGHLACVHLLLEKKASASDMDYILFTPLMSAASHGHLAVVKRLLREPCTSLDAVNMHGETATSLASHHNHLEILTMLLTAGADPWLGVSLGPPKAPLLQYEWVYRLVRARRVAEAVRGISENKEKGKVCVADWLKARWATRQPLPCVAIGQLGKRGRGEVVLDAVVGHVTKGSGLKSELVKELIALMWGD